MKGTLETIAAQLDNFDRRFSNTAGMSSSSLNSSEMQKLASLGYVGLQKSSAAAAPVAGIDPKDRIAIANEVAAVTSSPITPSNPDRAIAALRPVVSGDSGLYLAEYTLGVALAQKAQYAEAAKHLRKAIEIQPESAWAHYEIGATLLKTGDFKTAIVHLEIAASRLTAFAAAHTALAKAYEQAGRTDGAKKELVRAGQK